jgi:hypothetical protein
MNAETQIAYAAGFFDGEGCIVLTMLRNSGYPYPYYTVSLTATQLASRPMPLHLLKRLFGGNVRPAKGRASNQQPQMMWSLAGPKAYGALKAMFPFLLVKEEVAALAMLFLAWKDVNGKSGCGITTEEHAMIATLRTAVKFYNSGKRHLGMAPTESEVLADGGQNGSRREAVH